MARLLSCGFELGTTAIAAEDAAFSGVQGLTIEKSIRRTGRFSAETASSNAMAWLIPGGTFTLLRNYYFRAYVYFRQFPTADQLLIRLTNGGTTVVGVALRNSDKVLSLYTGTIAPSFGVSSPVVLNRWYEIDLRVKIGTGALDEAEARLDQTSFASAATQSWADGATNFRFGNMLSSTGRVLWDDIIVNDDQGANANSWPNGGGFHLLLPVSDVSRDAGWLDGDAAGTTNLWDSINNLPPTATGNSTSGQAGRRIQNAVNTTTQNYQCEVQSYTEAGVPASDTIRRTQAYCSHCNGTAGAGTMSGQVMSNPADGAEVQTTNTSIGIAWPTAWTKLATTEQWNPTVTRSTRPQIRLGKRFASTNRMEFALAGLLVESIPGGGAPTVNRQSMYL